MITEKQLKTYDGNITTLKENEVFVFGSNPQGRHGMGAAKLAIDNFGAIYGKGRGFAGQSYALVTKNLYPKGDIWFNGKKVSHVHEWNADRNELIIYDKAGERSLSPQQIINNIEDLYNFAKRFPKRDFLIAYTRGKNLNGYSSEEMAAFFSVHNIPENIVFNSDFAQLIVVR